MVVCDEFIREGICVDVELCFEWEVFVVVVIILMTLDVFDGWFDVEEPQSNFYFMEDIPVWSERVVGVISFIFQACCCMFDNAFVAAQMYERLVDGDAVKTMDSV